MSDTIQDRGRSYRVGGEEPCIPVPLPDWLPIGLPSGWAEMDIRMLPGYPGRVYARGYHKHALLRVIVSGMVYGDGKRWLHVSVSRKNREIPSWAAMCEVKEFVLGPERTALQVHPPRSKHVSIHDGCLHLWHCLDGDVTPDFTAGGESI
jgi:hypothetical protein